MIKKVFFLLLSLGMMLHAAPFVLKDGSAAKVVMTAAPDKTERFVAQDLAEHLSILTGAAVTVAGKGETGSVLLRKDPDFQEQEYEYKVENGKLVFTGKNTYGIVNAVYTFLDDECGFRWYTPCGYNRIPPKKALKLEKLDKRAIPFLTFRQLSTHHIEHPDGLKFCLRNRLNGGFPMHIDPDLLDIYFPYDARNGHQLFGYVTSKKTSNNWNYKWGDDERDFFEEHPEYYSMDKSGKRVYDLQLCFSNRGLRDLLLKRFSIELKRHPEFKTLAFSAEDTPGSFCYCKPCKDLEKKYESATGPYMDFVFEACNYLQKHHPGVSMAVLAYRKEQSEKPPKVDRPVPENLYCIFAPIDDDISKTITHKNNAETYKNLQGWHALTKNIWIWGYPIAYGNQHALFVPMHRYIPEFLALRKAGVNGGLLEHNVGMYTGSNFHEMLQWIFTRIYFKGEVDIWALAREFSDMYYGAASDGIMDFLRELADYAQAEEKFMPYDAGKYYQRFWTRAKIAEYTLKMDEWLKLTEGDAKAQARLKDLRINLDYMLLANFQKMRQDGVLPAGLTAQIVGDRLKQDIGAAFDFRYQDKKGFIRTWVEKHRPVDRDFPRFYFMASFEPAPLPEEFADIPESRISQSFPEAIWGTPVIEDADAPYGKALVTKGKEPLTAEPNFGYWDGGKKQDVAKRNFKREEIVPDQYKLYKIGRFKVPQTGIYHYGNWQACMMADELYDTENNTWVQTDVYLELKFEGPLYGGKGKENRILLSRIVHIKAE